MKWRIHAFPIPLNSNNFQRVLVSSQSPHWYKNIYAETPNLVPKSNRKFSRISFVGKVILQRTKLLKIDHRLWWHSFQVSHKETWGEFEIEMWYLDRLNHSNMNDLWLKIDSNRPKLVQQNNTKNWLFVCAFEQFCTFLIHFLMEKWGWKTVQQLWPVQKCYWFWTRSQNSIKTTHFVKVALRAALNSSVYLCSQCSCIRNFVCFKRFLKKSQEPHEVSFWSKKKRQILTGKKCRKLSSFRDRKRSTKPMDVS